MSSKTCLIFALAIGSGLTAQNVMGSATTILPLRLESVGTCTYGGSTTQTIEVAAGTNLMALPFSGTTAYDFYSPPLTATMSLTTGDKGGGTITMRNTSASADNDFAVVAAMQYYDYDPATGTETLIVGTVDSNNHNVNNGVMSSWAFPNQYLPDDRTIPVGHQLHARLQVTLSSGNPAGFGELLINGEKNSSTVLLPENHTRSWSFAAPTVTPPPALTSQPDNQTVNSGSTATFSVTATGVNLAYQWQDSSDGGLNWNIISGANSATYTTPAATLADNGKQFRVVVNGSCGPSLISSSATLTVNPPGSLVSPEPPAITLLSVSSDGCANLRCTGNPNQVYMIQATSDLLSGSWATISTNTLDVNGICLSADTSASQYPCRFYRTMVSF